MCKWYCGLDEAAAIESDKSRMPLAGTRLVRDWKGVRHDEVIVREDGVIEYGNGFYKSLSAVARKITGTNSYYRCVAATKRLDVKCPLKSIAGGLIEKEVIAQLGAVLGSPEFIRLAANDAQHDEARRESRHLPPEPPAEFRRGRSP